MVSINLYQISSTFVMEPHAYLRFGPMREDSEIIVTYCSRPAQVTYAERDCRCVPQPGDGSCLYHSLSSPGRIIFGIHGCFSATLESRWISQPYLNGIPWQPATAKRRNVKERNEKRREKKINRRAEISTWGSKNRIEQDS